MIMADTTTNSNWWIWKVFWILLVVTAVEVALGIIQPNFLVDTQFLGTKLLNHIFIVLTIVKAGYIVMSFMHLGHEKKSLQWTILLPVFILIPYLLALVLTEGQYMFQIR
jgi:caa(3)-type oxidase subunit IV